MNQHSPLPRSAPEAQGVMAQAILDFVTAANQRIQSMHSFMLLRHGTVIAEGWWHPYRPSVPHTLFSLSKSFTSTAVGLAVSEGLLSVNDPVSKFFAKDLPKKTSPRLAAMQVRHLLTMSTGHHDDTTDRIIGARNPFRAFLGLPIEHEPGSYFVYNSGASYMLAAIIQKLTGQTLAAYLAPRLFEPLGIETPIWETHRNGVNYGGWGLHAKTEDIARFGQLYLQNGLWKNRQILPAAWVQEATAKQVNNAPNPSPDWEQGYGYQFWRCQPANIYRGDGAFGQFCIVMPDQDAVLAITAGAPDMQSMLNLAWEILLPGMQPNVLPANEPAAEKLTQTLGNLCISPPPGSAASPQAARVSGRVFRFEANPQTLHSLSLDFSSNTFTYRLLGGGKQRGTHRLPFGSAAWVEGVTPLGSGDGLANSPGPRKVVSSGAWTAEDTFTLTICQYETPFTLTLAFRFAGEQVTLDARINVNFGPTELLQLVGKATQT